MPTKTILLRSLLAALAASVFSSQAQVQAPAQPADVDCGPDGCSTDDGMLFDVRGYGESQPQPQGNDSRSLQLNRRVDVSATGQGSPEVGDAGGKALISGVFSIALPNGGLVWASEDPTLGQATLNVQGASMVPFEGGAIAKPVRFHAYSNYASFIETLQVLVYRGSDSDRVSPLATIDLPVANLTHVEWDGQLTGTANLRQGDELIYIARAYGAAGAFDETQPQRMQLVSAAEYERGQQVLRDTMQKTLGEVVNVEQAQSLSLTGSIYGRNALRVQNIPIRGSRVRLYGRDVPEGAQLSINGQQIPIDLERKFVAEFLEPIGVHEYAVQLQGNGEPSLDRTLSVNVTGSYHFLVALADVTVSQNDVSGNVTPQAGNRQFQEDMLSEGRLAFYLKSKLRGRYLLTAQADTRENEIKRLFNGFFEADAQDIFRRLDPDLYYPTYGDDSNVYRDVDTQGRLYVRMDWDQNQALWGNFNTGITGTEFGQYNRSLYGAALGWRSRVTTELGDARSTLKLFGSEAQSAQGHSELLGTGGSLYYLRHTDVLPGSDKLVVEVRDRLTGRVEQRVNLQRGTDYELDELQGRLLLTRPLSQVTRENMRSLTRDMPLDGYDQVLLADYEYVPSGFATDNLSAGLRARHWFGEHFAVGGTYVDENRAGDDYRLQGLDLTLQAGRGTYLKYEQTRTESSAAPIYFSDNGGLSFSQRNSTGVAREGEAKAIEARANLKELGWTEHEWTVGAWWRDIDAGYSSSRYDNSSPIEEVGAEFLGYFSDRFSLYGRYSRAEQGAQALEQQQLSADWRVNEDTRLGAEVRRVSEQRILWKAEGLLAALSYRQRVGSNLELYGVGQFTADDDGGAYAKNNLLTAGAKYLFGDKSSVGAELSSGSRGQGGKIEGEYRLNPEHAIYGTWGYSTDRTERDALFNPALQNGWTLGQRWRVSNQVNVYNESQYLKNPNSDAAGLAHSFGIDFYPAKGWNLGFLLMDGQIDSAQGRTERRAYSVNGGRTDPRTQWSSKLEYRKDTGIEQREQWVTSNRLFYKINEDWRAALRFNYADTQDQFNAAAGAKMVEGNVGLAWRPHDNTRWAAFAKASYLYDVATLGQEGGNTYDQRSQILSAEAVYQASDRWELAGKLATRRGDYRTGRGVGTWLDSRATLVAAQVRYHLLKQWDGLAEYRVLSVKDGGRKRGWLVGVDRQLGENFKVGVGYNFTDFSDDLTDLEYDNRGWFLNLSGYY